MTHTEFLAWVDKWSYTWNKARLIGEPGFGSEATLEDWLGSLAGYAGLEALMDLRPVAKRLEPCGPFSVWIHGRRRRQDVGRVWSALLMGADSPSDAAKAWESFIRGPQQNHWQCDCAAQVRSFIRSAMFRIATNRGVDDDAP